MTNNEKPAAQTPWFRNYEGARQEWFRKFRGQGVPVAELERMDRRWRRVAALINQPAGLRNTEYHN